MARRFDDPEHARKYFEARDAAHRIRLGVAEEGDIDLMVKLMPGYYRLADIADASWSKQRMEIELLNMEIEDWKERDEAGR